MAKTSIPSPDHFFERIESEKYARETDRIAALADVLKLLGPYSTETISHAGKLRASCYGQIETILNPPQPTV